MTRNASRPTPQAFEPPSDPSRQEALQATTAEHRHMLILKVLAQEGACRVSDMARRFTLSEMTLRRDLQEMHDAGLLKRVHGGALPIGRDTEFGVRIQEGSSQKQQIGTAAAGLIQDGWSIYLDAGTTSMEVARAIQQGLKNVKRLAIVTNGINIAAELVGRTPYDIYAIGGEIYAAGVSAVGPMTLAQVANFHFDLFFMGARGVDAEVGWTNTNHLETQVKHAVMERSRQVCAIVDSNKWGQRALVSVVPFGAVTHWVCDARLPQAARDAASAQGVELVIAGA
jgi:DeoR/GlpR family transcriptional regulator of sugar metabolism